MSQLAIMEKENGEQLRNVRESFRSDYFGIPLLKTALRITAVYVLMLGICTVCHMEFLIDIVAEGKVRTLAAGVLAAYLSVLLTALIITFLNRTSEYSRDGETARKYEQLLRELREMEDTGI